MAAHAEAASGRARAGSWQERLTALGTRPLWVALALFLPLALPASMPAGFIDLWWALKAGELIAGGRGLLDRDVLSFAPVDPDAINQSWLAQLAYYGAYLAGGIPGATLLTTAAVAASFGLLLVVASRRAGDVRLASASVLLGMALTISNTNPRPQTLAFPLFMATYALLSVGWRSRWLWTLPAVEVLWANVHGSFVLGPLLAGLFVVGRAVEAWLEGTSPRALWRRPEVRRPALLLPLLLGATLVNPHGLGLWLYVARLGSNPIIRQHVSEWTPTKLGDVVGAAFFALTILTVVVLHVSRRRVGATDALLLLTFGVLALQALRNVAWWGWITTPILAAHLPHLPVPAALVARIRAANARPVSAAPWLNLAIAGFLLLLAVLSLPGLKALNPLLPPDRKTVVSVDDPVAAGEWLRAHGPPGRIFSYQPWGSYLAWTLWPQYQVFVHARVEVHPPEVWRDYFRIEAGNAAWDELLARYGADLLVLSERGQPELLPLVEASPAWRQVYADGQARIYRRAPPAAGQ